MESASAVLMTFNMLERESRHCVEESSDSDCDVPFGGEQVEWLAIAWCCIRDNDVEFQLHECHIVHTINHLLACLG